MNVIAEIQRINTRELELQVPFEASWHQKYKDSAWVYVGGLSFELTEGDVLCVMSQFGEIEDINLIRDRKTGKSKGFAFIKYENWLSTVLAVDNMNGARLLERIIRVDHVLQYKLPKEVQDRENEREAQLLEQNNSSDSEDDIKKKKKSMNQPRGLPGHAYEGKELIGSYNIGHGQNVFQQPKEKESKKQKKMDQKKEKKKQKKQKKLELMQAQWIEQVQQKRAAERAAELQALQQDGEDGGGVQASVTGWRGRFEPTAHMPQTKRPVNGENEDSEEAYLERERKRRAAYGGINRVR